MNLDVMNSPTVDLLLTFVPPTADKNYAAAPSSIAFPRSRQQVG
jgi:hypothetical protein